jgi:uncharacterized membrane protein YsdA (DUF1294 family)
MVNSMESSHGVGAFFPSGLRLIIMKPVSWRPVHWVVLGGLLGAPGLAVRQLAGHGWFWWIIGWAVGVSVITYGVYVWDKRQATAGGSRISELRLHGLAFVGGWPGAFVAQHHLRHKNAKMSFQCGYWLIVVAHEWVAVDFLLGWRWTRAVFLSFGF